MKKIILLVTILLVSFFATNVQAQELALFRSGDVIDTAIQNAKIAEWTGNKSIYVIEFELANNLSKDQEGIKYALELYDSSKEQGKFLVDQKVYDEIINLEPKESKLKRIQYDFPVSFQGEYELHLLIATEEGIVFNRRVLGVISKDKAEGVFIDITKCQNKIGFDEYHIFKEIDLSNKESFEIRCRDLESLSSSTLDFYPKVIIKHQTKFGEVIEEKVLEKQSLESKKSHNFSFQISTTNDSSYRYKGELMLVDESQKKVSNSIYFSYVIKKDENGNIIQDPDDIDEVMEINQVDVGDEVKDFPVMNFVVIIVLFIALIVVLIFVFRRFK